MRPEPEASPWSLHWFEVLCFSPELLLFTSPFFFFFCQHREPFTTKRLLNFANRNAEKNIYPQNTINEIINTHYLAGTQRTTRVHYCRAITRWYGGTRAFYA